MEEDEDADEPRTPEEREIVEQAIQGHLDYLYPPEDDDDEDVRSESKSIKSMLQSVRSNRSANHDRLRGKFKVRSMVNSDKLQWNGRRST